MLSLNDSIVVGDAVRTKDGYLVADARVARTGIQVYQGSELGLLDRATVRVYRPEDQVFHKDSIKSYAHRPVTLNHPKDGVNAKNWKKLAIGQTGDEVVRDGQFVRVPMVIMDEDAITAYDNGVRELSMGYSCNIELTDGISPDGEAYDAIMTDMRMNHLAVVAKARGGSGLKLGDNLENDDMADNPVTKTVTVVVDGLSVATTEQGAEALRKVQAQLADATSKASEVQAAHDAALSAKDAEIDALKAKVLDDAAIGAKVLERTTLIDTAKKLDPTVVVDGKDPLAIKTAVLAKLLTADAVAGKDAAYINMRFQIAAEDAALKKPVDPVAAHLRGGHAAPTTPVNDARSAYAANIQDLNTAWMGDAARAKQEA